MLGPKVGNLSGPVVVETAEVSEFEYFSVHLFLYFIILLSLGNKIMTFVSVVEDFVLFDFKFLFLLLRFLVR